MEPPPPPVLPVVHVLWCGVRRVPRALQHRQGLRARRQGAQPPQLEWALQPTVVVVRGAKPD